MMANDTVGDCTCAAVGHMLKLWASRNDIDFTPTDEEILAAYSSVSGYNPNDPSTDVGATCIDVLNYWRKTGIAGHKIFGYASVNIHNPAEVRAAIDLFGAVYTGVALPVSAQSQSTLWDLQPGYPNGNESPGSWGGHCVPLPGYDPNELEIVTWGQQVAQTYSFFAAYCDEAYAVLSVDWAEAGRNAPSGFNFAQLEADLSQVT
jgi:hypothetical protein